MRNLFTIAISLFLLLSCNSKSTKADTKLMDSFSIDATSSNQHTDSISIEVTSSNQNTDFSSVIDSISDYYNGIVGNKRVECYLGNDSTCRFVPGHLQRYVNHAQKIDSLSLPYARKAHITVYEGGKSIKKEITRTDLYEVTEVEDIEYFQIYTIKAKYSQDKKLLFSVTMSMDDTYYVYEFDYEYRDGKFTLIEFRIEDDYGTETIKME